jgi:hypothetical protein
VQRLEVLPGDAADAVQRFDFRNLATAGCDFMWFALLLSCVLRFWLNVFDLTRALLFMFGQGYLIVHLFGFLYVLISLFFWS